MQVKLTFNDGSGDYDLPIIQSVSDPKEAIKATVIPGTRGDGSLVIPGGKKSPEINVRGKIVAEGYKLITEAMDSLRTNITTLPATLTLQYNEGSGWVTSWSRTVRRIEEIRFPIVNKKL
jgi:hypothetical protein